MRAAAIALFCGALGCNAILGIDYGEPKPALDGGARDASFEASVDANSDASEATNDSEAAVDMSLAEASDVATMDTADVGPVCGVKWPAPPKRDDAPPEGGASAVQFTVAVEKLRLKRTDDLGYDLDNRCTCSDMDPDSCNRRADHSAATNCDGPGGRDAVGNTFLETWVTYGETALSEEALGNDLAAGRAGALVKVSGYNGLANDQLVTVEFFGRAWMQVDGGARRPRFDGSDGWTVYAGSIMVGSTSVESDPIGYVSDNVLVARLKKATIALRPNTGAYDNPLILEFRDAMLTGNIVKGDVGYRLEGGYIAGRWPTDAALSSFSLLADSDSGGFICENHPLFPFLQQYVCAEADIMSSRVADNTGADCDAISFAIGFDAGPARIVDVATPPIVPTTCPNAKPTCPGRDR